MRLRIALPFSAQGLPLGILEVATLGKEDKAAFADRQEDAWAPIREAQHRCPKSRVVTVGDCEGDIYAFFEEALQQKCDSLVRAKGNESQLQPYLQSLPEAGDVALPVALQGPRSARTARLSVRFAALAAGPNPRLVFEGHPQGHKREATQCCVRD